MEKPSYMCSKVAFVVRQPLSCQKLLHLHVVCFSELSQNALRVIFVTEKLQFFRRICHSNLFFSAVQQCR